ncbi:MAG: methyltransferase domain-containing protein, partial [Hyphomicrobiales bacterium]|nr:methyltransferase domain-containing protein [Hyphomicrobiales bacterium]
RQLRTYDVTDAATLQAFLDVPREPFVAPSAVAVAYGDSDLPCAAGSKRRLLAPLALARLVQALDVKRGERALEVAAGSGYGAALLAKLGAKATALESDEAALAAARTALADSGVEVVAGDPAAGAPRLPAFDVILVNGACAAVPSALIERLAPGGRLAYVDVSTGAGSAILVTRSASDVGHRRIGAASGPLLPEFNRAPEFAF